MAVDVEAQIGDLQVASARGGTLQRHRRFGLVGDAGSIVAIAQVLGAAERWGAPWAAGLASPLRGFKGGL